MMISMLNLLIMVKVSKVGSVRVLIVISCVEDEGVEE